MQAIILASGRGARFQPLTDAIPKPCIPLSNRPILEHLLETLATVGCNELFVTVGYAGEQLFDYLTSIQISSAITPVEARNWKHGPLASFQAALPHLSPHEPFVLVPGDLYISTDNLRLLLSSSVEMALLYDSTKQQPGTLIQMNSSQGIRELVQSSTFLQDYFTSVPALRATPEFSAFGLKASPDTQSTVFTLLRHWLTQGGTLQGIPTKDKEWCDIDTPRQLVTLNHHLLTNKWPLDPLPPGKYLPPGETLKGPEQSEVLSIGNQTQIHGPVLLGNHVKVGENCVIRDGTTLGNLTVVQDNSELVNCITLPETQVPANVDLKNALLDAKGNIIHSQ